MAPLKYHVFENMMENGSNAPFSIIFSKVFKTLLNFFLNFSMLSKNRNGCHDLKIAYEVKGYMHNGDDYMCIHDIKFYLTLGCLNLSKQCRL